VGQWEEDKEGEAGGSPELLERVVREIFEPKDDEGHSRPTEHLNSKSYRIFAKDSRAHKVIVMELGWIKVKEDQVELDSYPKSFTRFLSSSD
jgi:hypothetical protein